MNDFMYFLYVLWADLWNGSSETNKPSFYFNVSRWQKYTITFEWLVLHHMESTRLKKVSRLLEKDLGEIFQQMAKSTFPGVLLTVTKVRITPDLSVAKAYISIFPVTSSKEIMHHIQTQTNFLRNELANRVRLQLRIIPDLQFFLDDSLDYEENINRLLRGEGENPILWT